MHVGLFLIVSIAFEVTALLLLYTAKELNCLVVGIYRDERMMVRQ
jgi:hypothetical protein